MSRRGPPGSGPLPGAGSASGSAGRFFRGPVPRLTTAARRLLTGGSLVPGSAGGSLVPGSAGGSLVPGSAGGSLVPGSAGGSLVPGSAGGSLVPGSAGGSLIPGSAGGLLEGGDVPVLPPVDEAVRVVEVLIGGQQVRVRPHGVPAGGAPDIGQLAPDEGRLAQLARP